MDTLIENTKRVLLLLAESVTSCNSVLLMSVELDIEEKNIEEALRVLKEGNFVKSIGDVYYATSQGIINARKIEKKNRKELEKKLLEN